MEAETAHADLGGRRLPHASTEVGADGASARGGLGCAEGDLTVHLAELADDVHGVGFEVDVAVQIAKESRPKRRCWADVDRECFGPASFTRYLLSATGATDHLVESASKEIASHRIDSPQATDAAAIGSVHLQAWIETYQNPERGIDEDWIRRHVGFVDSEDGTKYRAGIIAKVDGGDTNVFYKVVRNHRSELVGFVHANRLSDYDEIDGIYLLRSAQGLGIGHGLLAMATTWLASSRPLHLEVIAYNQHAIDFYSSHGFVTTGTAPDWQGIVPVAVMQRGPHRLDR